MTFFILKSMPIVDMKVDEKESLAYRRSKHVFPTAGSVTAKLHD
jgi:hypothetical protein